MKFDNLLLKNPIVSLSDRKSYKFIQLQNGLKVLFIKQENDNDDLSRYKKYKSNVAAVAMCVDGGSFQDPQQIQGMSHLLEHVVRKSLINFQCIKMNMTKTLILCLVILFYLILTDFYGL